jgi:pyridoxine kinase
MKSIISIQSHYVSGHVGNSTAVFPMQKMGMEVWPIHSAQFSTNTLCEQDYSKQRADSDNITALMNGLDKAGKLSECGAVLSGHQCSELQYRAVVEAVQMVRKRNPSALYVCEPEFNIGERADKPPVENIKVIKHTLVPMSDAAILGQIELGELTGLNVDSLYDVVTASKMVLDMGPKMVLIKHFEIPNSDTYNVLLSTRRSCFIARLPKIKFDDRVLGVGNLFSSLFTACLVRDMLPLESFRHAFNAAYGVLEVTKEQDACELQIIDAQYEFVEPTHEFDVCKVS